MIQTATGSSPHYRDGLEVTIRGVTIYPESFTTLETEIERRAAIDRQFDEVLDEVIAEVTDELEQAAEVSATRLDEVEVEARQKVADAIEAFYLDVERAATHARNVESENQADTQVRGPGSTSKPKTSTRLASASRLLAFGKRPKQRRERWSATFAAGSSAFK